MLTRLGVPWKIKTRKLDHHCLCMVVEIAVKNVHFYNANDILFDTAFIGEFRHYFL